jgi:hypothetical protein
VRPQPRVARRLCAAPLTPVQVRTLTLLALLVVVGSWYGMHRARVGRARRYGREAMERWEAEGGAPLPDSDRGN